MTKKYEAFKDQMRKIADVSSAIAVLSWDKEVMLPKDGARFRSQQVATLSAIAHGLSTDDNFGKLLIELNNSQSLTGDEKRNVELALKDFEKATKLSESFVIQFSKASSAAYHAWIDARNKNDFSVYAKPLGALINLMKEESELLTYDHHPYDAQLDKYEPGMTVNELEGVFTPLKKELQMLTNEIANADKINNDVLHQYFDKDLQWNFGIDVLKQMSYNFDSGRQDLSAHPFTISFSPEDVRVTTRVDEIDFSNMLWSCIHEGGHALYEQGLLAENYGLPLGSAVSLGIHESQSRLWENHVGRSLSFWKYFYPKLRSTFEQQFKDISLEHFYKIINKIEPNLIRTEADELHYHLHVIIRYEIEKEIMEGNIGSDALYDLWNNKYESYLGIRPENDNSGILQDIHWSHGSIGYFPTYSLGSLYSAQFYAQADLDINNLKEKMAMGDYNDLLSWLRTNIHQYGRKYDAQDLCERVTGSKLNSKYFLNYASLKFKEVYQID